MPLTPIPQKTSSPIPSWGHRPKTAKLIYTHCINVRRFKNRRTPIKSGKQHYSIHFNFLQVTPLPLYPDMALAVFHGLKDKTNLTVNAVWKWVVCTRKLNNDQHIIHSCLKTGSRLLTLHRAAVSMFLHQYEGPLVHSSVPNSLDFDPGQAPIFWNTHFQFMTSVSKSNIEKTHYFWFTL